MNAVRKLLVVCGPSGSGKSTVLRRLFEEHPKTFGFSVSHTSRDPRPGERDGVHYYFSTRESIEAMVEDGLMLESAVYSGHYYGTSLEAVHKVWQRGRVCVLDIEIEGVKQVKKLPELEPVLVFVKPPSLAVLEERLKARGTETRDSLRRRLERAGKEMEYGDTPGYFHKVIVNDDLDRAYREFEDFVMSAIPQ